MEPGVVRGGTALLTATFPAAAARQRTEPHEGKIRDESVLVADPEVAVPHGPDSRLAHGPPLVRGARPEHFEFSPHPLARALQGVGMAPGGADRDVAGLRPELVIVPHTHWDREWYEPFQVFRMRLVAVLDGLLKRLEDEPGLCFTLDGQTAAVDDYLEIRPSQEGLVRALVELGALDVGPWRVLADSFLCSGENLVRNLELGMRRSAELGGTMMVGYLPDQFGHCAQLPQILRNAGIAQACVWRGVPEAVRSTSFAWVAPDGTTIRTRYLPEGGYGAASGLFAVAEAAAVATRAREHVRALRAWQETGPLLGMYGTDHSAPAERLTELLDEASAMDAVAPALKLSTLGGFLAKESTDTQYLLEVHGELRSHARADILPGVISARVPLKAALSRAERLVERYAEPLTALYGMPFATQPFLDLAWRRLIDASGHDSVTGCGVDATADQVATRIAEASDLGRGVCDLVLSPIAATVPEGGHVVFNPSPFARTEVVTLDIPDDHVLAAADGTFISHQTIATERPVFSDADVPSTDLDRFLRRIHGRELYGRQIAAWWTDPERGELGFRLAATSDLDFDVTAVRRATDAAADVTHWRIRVLTPARQTVATTVECGPLALTSVTSHAPDLAATAIAVPSAAATPIASGRGALSDLDNGLIHIAMRPDGLLDLLAADGTHASGLGTIADGGDLGDEYNHAPPATDRRIYAPDEVWNRVLWDGPLTGCVESVRWYAWPSAGDFTADTRTDTTTLTEVRTRVELRRGEPFARLHITFDNQTDDHRVRLHLPLPRRATTSHAEGQFAVTDRPLTAEGGHGETPIPTFPAYGWVAAGGLAILLDHISEYELIDDGRTLAVTLLRSVGMLSRHRNAFREEPAGPQRETPGAQCHGPLSTELGVYLYAGEWHTSGLLKAAERFRHPFSTTAGWNPNPENTPSIPEGGLHIAGDGVVMTSCRDIGPDAGGAPEIRVVALTPHPTTATISRSGGNVQDVPLRAWQIATARVS